ncbi:unnamed protein product [Amoebophrya sp. A25]|nr:unnamed protein product [Amoebophrya sp. A25]|eukprot:GSA25T00016327001.1
MGRLFLTECRALAWMALVASAPLWEGGQGGPHIATAVSMNVWKTHSENGNMKSISTVDGAQPLMDAALYELLFVDFGMFEDARRNGALIKRENASPLEKKFFKAVEVMATRMASASDQELQHQRPGIAMTGLDPLPVAVAVGIQASLRPANVITNRNLQISQEEPVAAKLRISRAFVLESFHRYTIADPDGRFPDETRVTCAFSPVSDGELTGEMGFFMNLEYEREQDAKKGGLGLGLGRLHRIELGLNAHEAACFSGGKLDATKMRGLYRAGNIKQQVPAGGESAQMETLASKSIDQQVPADGEVVQ